ncbi:MAG: plasminogen-binding N-terminal domain-containing protein [Campylobacterota bacterium]|nr:plasminogen-binding N-terminal domain-containing protein [Campylobacterota bacterium]
MKYIFMLLMVVIELFGGVVKSPIVSVNVDETLVSIKIAKIDVGMSGFVVHNIAQNHSTILKSAVVKSYDEQSQIATLELSEYDALRQNSLPNGKWHVEVGDMVVLAFGYTRGLLIAPSEDIYYRVTRATKHLQWIHPDIFATLLSFNGHPTPLREDFKKLALSTSVGLLFFYIEKKLYTVDSQSFKILNISDAPLVQKDVKPPFYTRVEEIEASWWGEGSDELESYAPHYYKLLLEANPNHKKLQAEIDSFNKKGQS